MTCCSCTRSPMTRGRCGRQLGPDRDGVAGRLAAQEDDHLANDLVQINRLPLRSALPEEQARPADDVRRARSVLHDAHRGRARFREIRGLPREPVQAGVGVGDDRGDRLVHLVGQGRGQRAHGRHPIDVGEIGPRLAQRFFRALLLEQGGAQREGEQDERRARDHQRQRGLVEPRVLRGLVERAVNREDGRAHRGVVHPGDGQAHDDGGDESLAEIGGPERQPQGRGRRADGDDQGERDEADARS